VKTGFDWPANYKIVKGSDAMAKAVNATPGSIGYVDFGYVKDNKLAAAKMNNAEGEFVLPSIEAFRSALSNSEWVSKGSLLRLVVSEWRCLGAGHYEPRGRGFESCQPHHMNQGLRSEMA